MLDYRHKAARFEYDLRDSVPPEARQLGDQLRSGRQCFASLEALAAYVLSPAVAEAGAVSERLRSAGGIATGLGC